MVSVTLAGPAAVKLGAAAVTGDPGTTRSTVEPDAKITVAREAPICACTVAPVGNAEASWTTSVFPPLEGPDGGDYDALTGSSGGAMAVPVASAQTYAASPGDPPLVTSGEPRPDARS